MGIQMESQVQKYGNIIRKIRLNRKKNKMKRLHITTSFQDSQGKEFVVCKKVMSCFK